jgi:hypothetical protein
MFVNDLFPIQHEMFVNDLKEIADSDTGPLVSITFPGK